MISQVLLYPCLQMEQELLLELLSIMGMIRLEVAMSGYMKIDLHFGSS